MPRSTDGRTEERSLQELWAQFSAEASTLIRKEVELARVEMKESASRVAKAGTMFTLAGLVAFVAAQALTVALGFALATFMPDGIAALVVGVVYMTAAVVTAMVAKSRVARMPAPQAVRTIKDDLQVAKQSLSEGASTESAYGRPWAPTRS